MENTELVERLEQVERDNQRLKLALGALMLVLVPPPVPTTTRRPSASVAGCLALA